VVPALIGATAWLYRRRESDIRTAAASLEQRYGELDSRLLTALALEPNGPDGKYTYLQSSVLADAIEHARRHPWTEVVPGRRLMRWQLARFGSIAALLVAAIWA
jgi:hypothetical protein